MMMLSASMCLYKGHKLIVMGYFNFEDHALIKRWRANEKMNVMGEMFKDEKKRGNRQKQFSFIVGSYMCSRSFGVHNIMSVESAIEKLDTTTKCVLVHSKFH